jgi:hypothetical protein
MIGKVCRRVGGHGYSGCSSPPYGLLLQGIAQGGVLGYLLSLQGVGGGK